MATNNFQFGEDIFGKLPKKLVAPDLIALLQEAIPGYAGITGQMGGNILAGLRGELSPDVQRTVEDAANAQAFRGGFSGSGLGRNLSNRDLGLTSKAIQDLAATQGQSFINTLSKAAIVDPGIQTEIQKFNKLIAASPNPVARGNFELEQFNKALARSGQGRSPIFNPNVGGGGSGGAGAGASTPSFSFNPFPIIPGGTGSAGSGGLAQSNPWQAPNMNPIVPGFHQGNIFGPGNSTGFAGYDDAVAGGGGMYGGATGMPSWDYNWAPEAQSESSYFSSGSGDGGYSTGWDWLEDIFPESVFDQGSSSSATSGSGSGWEGFDILDYV